ncbi:MAG: hypothetical protein J2P57_04635 [Acidimicrobiaceae bacterium]|nr:hypothetical protein [Acidimicrobiaceae bacterium]
MSLEQHFGTIVTPDVSVSDSPRLHRPERYEALPTGFALIDTLVPIPRGGLVELRGGWLLVMLNELIGNMAALGPAVMVAVGTRRPDANGVYARTHRLIQLEATRHLVVVVEAHETLDADALRAGGRLARQLAAEGNDVVLVVDHVVSESVGPNALRAELGLGEQGSVTGLRLSGVVIDNRPSAGPGAWVEADAVLELSLSELVRGRFPAVDLSQSRSAVLDNPDLAPHHRRLAHQAHELLAQAEALKVALNQSVDIGEGWIGHSSNPVDVEEALRQLDQLLPRD